MTLQNLLAIHRLHRHVPDAAAIAKLLKAAHRSLADACVDSLSTDGRFDAAYRCVMQCAMLGLWANGYRTATSQPGHHQTAIQCLTLTLGVPASDVIVLDGLRKQGNLSDYQGDPVTDAALACCLEQADSLLVRTEAWLREHRPDLSGSSKET